MWPLGLTRLFSKLAINHLCNGFNQLHLIKRVDYKLSW